MGTDQSTEEDGQGEEGDSHWSFAVGVIIADRGQSRSLMFQTPHCPPSSIRSLAARRQARARRSDSMHSIAMDFRKGLDA